MRIQKFHVTPALPERLAPLREIAHNLRWSWDHDSIELFRRISKRLWESCGHSPVRVLGEVDQDRLDVLAADEGFRVHMERVLASLRRHLDHETWFDRTFRESGEISVAYFSAEFGLTESLPIYSGGLGILAGDHLKASSELGVPLVGVGLLYQKGYFQQYLTNDGWQHERYPLNDFPTMPVSVVTRPDGSPLRILVEMADKQVVAQVWRVQVGRIPLFLLDTNIDANPAAEREISAELYGGDKEMRIRQELLLGVGGFCALRAMDIVPTVCHMNEGHSAFLGLERIWALMETDQVDFEVARRGAEAGNAFTTHTPVPAGIDVFPKSLVKTYLEPYARKMKVPVSRLLHLGQDTEKDEFSMAVLAMRLSNRVNGVSKLHGEVSRKMFTHLWPGAPLDEIPIGHITNGIHARSWISFDMATLFDRYLGPKWSEDPSDQSVWESARDIPDEELWRTHERRRERLVAFARRTLAKQLRNRGAPDTDLRLAGEVLDPRALTIGFARRFARYKRGTLLFRNFERLVRILSDHDRPVQIIFAGKAHPQDERGKELIRELIGHMRDERIRRRVVFLEDYDMTIARYIVQGCDVWLNTPRRPREASGTSGMKAMVNGAPNLSILDGWWDEAYTREVGWAIGHGEEYEDHEYQDRVESRAVYDLLENDIVPLFYERGGDDVPRGWTAKMKASLSLLAPVFNTNRMVWDYVNDYYYPCAARYRSLTENGSQRARVLTEWRQHVETEWQHVRIRSVHSSGTEQAKVGGVVDVWCQVALGALTPEDVVVQVFHGRMSPSEEIVDHQTVTMSCDGEAEKRVYLFRGSIACQRSGQEGFAVRVMPSHEDLCHPHHTRLIHWAG
ncbi:MAG: alpha-glucan family phosphorylase [Candidatus Eisenbacteria sp.]|nr:alpha-glucan family phosphorylase [Candidatus Eisenbacteria bacterium]